MPKNSKRGHLGPLNVFTNRNFQKNARGGPLIELENFRKKKSHSAEKTQRGPFGIASTFGSIKICGLVRESNPRSPGSENWYKLNK